MSTTQQKKQKGRTLQQWMRKKLIEILDLKEDDVISRSMGSPGEDIILSYSAKQSFPCSIECKNQETAKMVYDWLDQAKSNANGLEPIVVFKRNYKQPVVIVDATYFIKLFANRVE